MSRILAVSSLAVLLSACGGGKKTDTSTTPTGGGDGVSTGGGGDAGDGAQTCEPGRCLDDIKRLIAERKTDSRGCYDAARKRNPGLAGKVIINFAIDSEGVVGETAQGIQDGQLQDQELVACLSAVINTVRFAASPKGKTTRAYHRFEFSP